MIYRRGAELPSLNFVNILEEEEEEEKEEETTFIGTKALKRTINKAAIYIKNMQKHANT